VSLWRLAFVEEEKSGERKPHLYSSRHFGFLAAFSRHKVCLPIIISLGIKKDEILLEGKNANDSLAKAFGWDRDRFWCVSYGVDVYLCVILSYFYKDFTCLNIFISNSKARCGGML